MRQRLGLEAVVTLRQHVRYVHRRRHQPQHEEYRNDNETSLVHVGMWKLVAPAFAVGGWQLTASDWHAVNLRASVGMDANRPPQQRPLKGRAAIGLVPLQGEESRGWVSLPAVLIP